jgi:hypothetical protein
VRCTVSVAAENAAFPPSGGSGTVRITTNRECQWTARAEAPWITLSGGEGQGEESIRFTVASNADPASRNTAIVVNDQRLQIAQQGRPCEFTLSSNREVVDAAGGDRDIRVRTSSAQCTWTATANDSWITIVSGREGRGDGEVTFRVGAGTSPRTGALTIARQTVEVEQRAGAPGGPGGPGGPGAPDCTYSVANETFTVAPSGGDRQIAVTASSGCAWTAASNTPWITVLSGSTGSGAGIVAFRVAATDGPERTGTLTVAGRAVMVVQGGGCSVAVSPLSLNAPADGARSPIQVETAAGCTWSAATEVPWIAIAGPASGSGRAQVPLVVSANIGPARSGSVVVAGHRVAIAQASGCRYSVSPSAQQISGSGGTAAASVATAAGCAWSASSGASWITIATPSGSGPGQATFTVAPNLSPTRSGTLTIAGRTHTINQASQCTWTFNPPSHEMPAPGGLGTVLVFVSGACTWTTTSTVDWIRIVAGSSGTGGGLVQFNVAPNGGAARTAVVVIGSEKYQVTQHAGH